MKNFKFLLIGIFFGIVLTKSEVISWFRIYEMFKFQSFHMYGIIGSAVILGIPLMYLFNKQKIKTNQGVAVKIELREKGLSKNLLGGIIFGLGWALGGACPGPMFALIGKGIIPIVVVLFGAVLGAFAYHGIKHKLPH
ncbi:MAG: YeeE/YedE family protein [Flavobacteriales bacterium]|nr:YeeE/YedE family protein [Flavobacteriales bacterium]